MNKNKLPETQGKDFGQILESLTGIDSILQAGFLTDFITKEQFTSGNLDISRRHINYWDNEGLLITQRKEGEKWRRFSFVELVWLLIVNELRTFGCPLELIKKLKGSLFSLFPVKEQLLALKKDPKIILSQITDPEEKQFVKDLLKLNLEEQAPELNFLTVMIFNILSQKQNLAILIFSDGSFFPYVPGEEKYLPKEIQHSLVYNSYLRVSLTKILCDFLSDEKAAEFIPKLNILQPSEQKLLEIIQSEEYNSITVHFKDKKMNSLELHKRQDVKKKVVDILQENQYQQVVIKSHKGMVTTIENTVKVYLDEKK